MKLFFTGPVVKTELMVVMLEKHGIAATQEYVDPAAPDDGDFVGFDFGGGHIGGVQMGLLALLRPKLTEGIHGGNI